MNSEKDSQFNLTLQNGAQWVESAPVVAVTFGLTREETSSDIYINSLVGGEKSAEAGNIFRNSNETLVIASYTGNTNIFYAHETGTPTNIIGGDTVISSAAAGSSVTLITDNSGFTVSDENAQTVNEVLDALAHKLV